MEILSQFKVLIFFINKTPFFPENFQELWGFYILSGGSDEDRTRYLVVANDALSQMSYRPSDKYYKINTFDFQRKNNTTFRKRVKKTVEITLSLF